MIDNNKQKFIQEVSSFLDKLSPEAIEYFKTFSQKKQFTVNGAKILEFLQKKENANQIFKAKEIGEALYISSRSVSGSMKKLVTDGYVEKLGQNPTTYKLTLQGMEAQVDN